MNKKAVILLSGGLDSTTCLAMAKSQGYKCYALSFAYGQKHENELEAAQKIAKEMEVVEHRIVNLDIGKLGGSALTDERIDVPNYDPDGKIPVTYVPARNTIFLSIALGFAEIIKAHDIFIGVSQVDYSGYPDCRPEFIEAFTKMARLATKMGVEDNNINVRTPLMCLSKAETIQLGMALGVDYSLTVSCYKLNEDGAACGVCDSCVLRKKGFTAAGVHDPTYYQG